MIDHYFARDVAFTETEIDVAFTRGNSTAPGEDSIRLLRNVLGGPALPVS